MEDWDQVDGCVIFYKNKLFEFVEEHHIEFQAMAMARHKEFEADQEALMRIMTKDNIALAVVLRISGQKPIVVVNTHIYWDPQYSDVKLIQVQFMMERIAAIAGPGAPWEGAPVIICGDFNSVPGSGPYELITSGAAPAAHVDLQEGFQYGSYSKAGFSHPFSLESVYHFMGEPPFTNYTLDYVGVLDYIFITNKSLRATQVLQPLDAATVKSTRLPNPYYSSDHVSLMAELQIL
jgi:CCR4-NOT transcription complex subunit 6